MGVCINLYRISIGTFNNNRCYLGKNTEPRFKSRYNFFKNYKHKFILILIISSFLINNINCQSNYNAYMQKHNNKIAHITNGNITKLRNIKFLQWNKGNSNFSTKIDDLKIIIDKFQPHVISICEANYCNVTKEQINNYNIETNDLGIGYEKSRVLLLIHESIQYKRRLDLEKPYLAIIICDLKLNNKINTTVTSIYRQWSIPKSITINNNHMESPINRYKCIIDICENIIKNNKEMIIIGDDNIDTIQS